MRCLHGLKEIFGFQHKHFHTILILGFLTSNIKAICTSEYHQKHELHTSGNTVEQHDVYDTFASVLEIMLIAKSCMVKIIDDSKNIMMSKKDCKYIGTGLTYREIHEMNDTYDGVAKLTKDIIVDDQIMVTGDSFSALVSKEYYVRMLTALDIQDGINMNADHALIVVKSGSDYVITNIDNDIYSNMDVICTISQDYLNIRNIIIPSLKELHKIFSNILSSAKIFPQVLDTAKMQDCLQLGQLDFWTIMEIKEENLEKCLRHHGNRDKRSLLAWIDGSQIEIDAVSNALDATIDVFNQDLLEIENFNRRVATGYNHLQHEMSTVEEFINKLRDVVILEEIKADIRERKAFYHRMRLTQALNFNTIVLNSDTAELVKIINNCVYGHLTCTISNCEVSLNCGMAQDSTGKKVLEIHREFAQLHTTEGFLIGCEPISPTHISTWHGSLAAGYGNSSLVIHKKIIGLDDLTNNSLVNANVRPIQDKEKILDNFIILPFKIICLNHIDAFTLDGKILSCDSLQVIDVKNNYTIVLGNNTYTHLQKTLSHKKTYKLEKGVYREMKNDIRKFQGSVYDTIIETVFLDKIGKVSHEKSSAFGIIIFLIIIIIISIIYWKCACCRNNLENLCLFCMPNCLHVWREKRALKKLQREEERADRLQRLETEGANTSNTHTGDDRHPGVSVWNNVPHPGNSATPQGGEPPSHGSATM